MHTHSLLQSKFLSCSSTCCYCSCCFRLGGASTIGNLTYFQFSALGFNLSLHPSSFCTYSSFRLQSSAKYSFSSGVTPCLSRSLPPQRQQARKQTIKTQRHNNGSDFNSTLATDYRSCPTSSGSSCSLSLFQSPVGLTQAAQRCGSGRSSPHARLSHRCSATTTPMVAAPGTPVLLLPGLRDWCSPANCRHCASLACIWTAGGACCARPGPYRWRGKGERRAIRCAIYGCSLPTWSCCS